MGLSCAPCIMRVCFNFYVKGARNALVEDIFKNILVSWNTELRTKTNKMASAAMVGPVRQAIVKKLTESLKVIL